MITVYVDLFGVQRLWPITPEMVSTVNQDIAITVRKCIRDSFQGMADKTQSTKYWPEARQAVDPPEIGNGLATISIRHKGVRLHWRGGVVKPAGNISKTTGRLITSLLIPFRDSPLRGKSLAGLAYPEEELQVLGSVKTHHLFLARIQGRKRRTDGSLQKITPLGLLLKSVTIKAKPEVMPTRDTLQQQAAEAGRKSLTILLRQS